MITQHLYIKAVSSSLSARAINMSTGLVTLWLLSKILANDEFAYCMLAITFSRMVAFIVASGFMNVILYRVSRLKSKSDENLARKIGGTAFVIAAVGATVISLMLIVSAQPVARLFSEPELARWLSLLAILIPLNVSKMVLASWYRARQKIPVSVFFDMAVPSALRVIFLAMAKYCAGGGISIAIALSAALIVTIIWMFAIQPLEFANPRAIFTKWDIYYGFKIISTSLANLHAHGIDILLIGALSSATVTAEYVVASRLIQLLPAVHSAVNEILMPRLGALVSREAFLALAKEYHLSRLFALLTTIGGAIVLIILAPLVLPLFGAYHSSYPLTLLLSTAMIVRIGFGANGLYLKMAGYAGWDLLTTIVALVLTIALGILWIPPLSGAGGALAILVGAVVTQISVALVIWRLDNLATVDISVIVTITLSVAVLIFTAYGLISTVKSVVSLFIISGILGYLQRKVWLTSLLKLCNRGSEYETC